MLTFRDIEQVRAAGTSLRKILDHANFMRQRECLIFCELKRTNFGLVDFGVNAISHTSRFYKYICKFTLKIYKYLRAVFTSFHQVLRAEELLPVIDKRREKRERKMIRISELLHKDRPQ